MERKDAEKRTPGEEGGYHCQTVHTKQLPLSKYFKNVSRVHIQREGYSRHNRWEGLETEVCLKVLETRDSHN